MERSCPQGGCLLDVHNNGQLFVVSVGERSAAFLKSPFRFDAMAQFRSPGGGFCGVPDDGVDERSSGESRSTGPSAVLRQHTPGSVGKGKDFQHPGKRSTSRYLSGSFDRSSFCAPRPGGRRGCSPLVDDAEAPAPDGERRTGAERRRVADGRTGRLGTADRVMSVLDVFIACAPFIGSWFSQQHGGRAAGPPPAGTARCVRVRDVYFTVTSICFGFASSLWQGTVRIPSLNVASIESWRTSREREAALE